MTRPLSRFWLMSLLLGPTCALALEVGDIQVQSALNQLFDATIPLPTLTPEELDRISVKVASPSMFEEFGLDRTTTLTNLVFSIQYDAEGRVYVKVVSTQPIREPSLALLLEFGWPRGKTFREFTVLLDPVRRLAQRPSNRTKTVLNTPSTSTIVAAVPESRDPVAASFPVEKPSTTHKPGDLYGPVAPGEGLWGIALKIRPEGITREQMMQALFQANPQAFSSAGISGLKTGVQLRIPTYREIADSTGSPIALRMAALQEHPAIPDTAENTPPPTTPEAFPLAVTPIPEPVAITATPTPNTPVIAEQETTPARSITETVAAIAELTPEPSKPVATLPEQEEKPAPEIVVIPEPVAVQSASKTPFPEPTSATPLLSMIVAEILADAAQLPTLTVPKITIPEPSITEPSTEKPSVESPIPAVTVESSVETADPAITKELHPEIPVPVVGLAPPPEIPFLAIALEPPLEFPIPAAVKPQLASPIPSTLPDLTATQSDKKIYKGGEEYGPVSNNERLWDIATKVLPDPEIGRDVMMKALFLANPQAFSKPTMDYLKVGSMLRIPTLEEIIKYTDSPVAQRLLKQKKSTNAPKN